MKQDPKIIREKYIRRFSLLENPSFEDCQALLTAEKHELETGVDPIDNGILEVILTQ